MSKTEHKIYCCLNGKIFFVLSIVIIDVSRWKEMAIIIGKNHRWNFLLTAVVFFFFLWLFCVLQFGFSATHVLSSLKLMDAGLSKDDITVISMVGTAVQFFVPILTAKYTSGSKSISICLKTIFIRWELTDEIQFSNKTSILMI